MTTDALIEHQHLEACRNCGTITQGNFCQQCGQATHLHVPSAREFLHEFVAHYVALEGKLWHSLKLLIFKPGLLTREYIEGRRVRYVEPLRLYLSFSIIFFFIFKMSGVPIYGMNGEDAMVAVNSTTKTVSAEIRAAQEAKKAQELEQGQRDAVQELQGVSQGLSRSIEKFFALPYERQQEVVSRAFYSYTPYAIFLMMPVFAMYLKLLYLGSGRRYGEHFLFALHSNAFAFLMLSLFFLAHNWPFFRFVLMTWLVFYLPTAMRRVYGGGRIITALRWVVLGCLHFITMSLAVIAAVSMALVG